MVGGRRIIILILTLYLLIGTSFALIFPLGEAPDEPGHFAYTRFLSLNKKLPVLKPEEPAAAHHPPAYYTLIEGVEFPDRAVPLGEIDCHKVGEQLTAHHFAITIVACKNWLR